MRSRYTSFDEITAADPDCIVVLPCGYGLATALEQAPTREPSPRPVVPASPVRV